MDLIGALINLVTPTQLAFTVIGTALGLVVGCMPGINGSMLIALTLPITYYMSPVSAMNLLVSMYTGAITSGFVTATLLRIPGEPANVMTTFDAFPMARRGEAARALSLGLFSSVFGALFAWVALATLTQPLADIAIRFTPFNYFALVLTALVLIASVSQGSLVKGLLSAALGALFAFPGVDPSSGTSRYTFGWWQLTSGLDPLPVLVGMFAVATVLQDCLTPSGRADRIAFAGRSFVLRFAEWRGQFWNLLRSSAIGTWIGILPGVGAAVGSLVAYTFARSISKTPEEFGQGSPEGIVASEAANNATMGGSFIPLIAMGIPGSVTDVFLIGAMMIHGIQPGPLLFTRNTDVVYTIIGATLTSTLVMFGLMLASIPLLRRVIDVPKPYIIGLVLVFCVVGVFAYNNRWFEVALMLGFGVFGFGMERAGMPLGPFVIAFILAPMAEAKLRSGLMMTGGEITPLFTEPLTAGLLLVSLALLVWPFVHQARRRRTAPP
ncbi:MAG TPA: tripartite tricarboxylate transporter permease [Microvirga sp.]|jgi:putative tricarboxylic transport membrane protein|nr:tripartite tricarboxylate transporter permease [Microvirga sp.]